VQRVTRSPIYRFVSKIALYVTIALFLIQLPQLVNGRWAEVGLEAALQLFVMGWLLLLTFRTRTVSIRSVLSFWFVGFFAVIVLVFAFVVPVSYLFGEQSGFVKGFWVPIMEELLKALPLIVVLATALRRPQFQLAISDMLILGLAVGFGYAFHEDALWGRIGADGFGGSFWGVFFPTFYYENLFTVAHAGWTALIGLALGWWYFFRHKKFMWLIPAFVSGAVILDHMRLNYRGAGKIGDLMEYMVGSGRMLAEFLVFGIVVTVVFELIILWKQNRRDQILDGINAKDLLHIGQGQALLDRLKALHAAIIYMRTRNASHYAVWRWRREEQLVPTGAFLPVIEALQGWRREAGLPDASFDTTRVS